MATVQEIGNWIATYMGLSAYTDLNPSTNPGTFTPLGIDMDLGLIGINSARRIAERAHDFKYSETNAFLSVGSNGGSIVAAYQNANVTVTGTLNPNVAGTFTQTGTYGGIPFYTIIVTGTQYFLWNAGGVEWVISVGIASGASNYWILATESLNPSGTYTAHGTYTGSPVVSIGTANIGVKRVKYVSLPLTNGDYQPLEFLTSDQYTARQQMQIGREPYNPSTTLGNLGVSFLGNPLAYQNGQSIYLAGYNVNLPIITQLSIVQWLPDYIDGTETDFITTYGPDFLRFQGLLEVNKLFRRYAPKQEGNLDETAITAEASAALQTLIAWDNNINTSTTTPSPNLVTPDSSPG